MHDHRITLVHQAALGDTVLLIPLLKSLRMKWPAARIAVVTRDAFGKLLTHLGFADTWYSADGAEHTAWFGALDDGAAVPEWARCDLMISAVSDGRDCWAEHARLAVRRGRVIFMRPRAPAGYMGHVTQWHRQELTELGLPPAPGPERIGNPDGAILIHPGSGGVAKCWAAERFVALARALVERGCRVEFVLGDAELERWPRDLLAAVRGEFVCHEMLPLVQLAELMRSARGWVGNDSGPTHLAAAVGLAGVALFGPSDDIQWRPVGHVEVVRAGRSMDALGVDEVLRAVATSVVIRLSSGHEKRI